MANSESRFYLFYPLIFLTVLFALDKLIPADYFRKDFLQSGNRVYYIQREDQLEKLKKENIGDRKFILTLGDSRAYSYSDQSFEGERKKKYILYNFSAPQAVVSYHLYMLRKILASGKKPDLLFVVLSPEGFDDDRRAVYKPFLKYASDEEFREKYSELIPEADKRQMLLDRIFVIRSIELDYKLLFERLQKKSLREYSRAGSKEYAMLNLWRGEQVAYAATANNIKKLEEDSVRLSMAYFGSYKIDETQFKFLNELLRTAKNAGIEVKLVWGKVYPKYAENFIKHSLKEKWEKRIIEMSSQYGYKFYNMNEVSDCDVFYDASHQSSLCYARQLNYLVDESERR
ncbi:MAG TPA: DUF1574 family protein [Leptospiraceae bacterium]|nr:DUF1574 family protein [Leptospiraceae bacterium]HNF15515.1 DUF1574 family protein [Leptospiraceae bacterium]HNN03432.1 DUF1574 family protein [Leptospiraceae bacterium]